MKNKRILIIFLCCIYSSSLASIIKIPDEFKIILQNVEYPVESTWVPNSDQVDKALFEINQFLENSDNFNIMQEMVAKKILNDVSLYAVEFVGIERNNQKIIFCNFFPRSKIISSDYFPYNNSRKIFSNKYNPNKKMTTIAIDGGESFWRIEYNLNEGQCLNFESNAEA